MSWGRIFNLSAVTVLGLALLPSDAVSQAKSIKEQLVGTWILVASDDVRGDGSRVEEYGPNPKGILIFESNGRYSVTIMRADLPRFAAGKADQGTAQENQAVVTGLVTHFGTYSVNEAEKLIISHIEASSFPNNDGIDQRRVIVLLTADELTYALPVTVTGTKAEVLWKRVK